MWRRSEGDTPCHGAHLEACFDVVHVGMLLAAWEGSILEAFCSISRRLHQLFHEASHFVSMELMAQAWDPTLGCIANWSDIQSN